MFVVVVVVVCGYVCKLRKVGLYVYARVAPVVVASTRANSNNITHIRIHYYTSTCIIYNSTRGSIVFIVFVVAYLLATTKLKLPALG